MDANVSVFVKGLEELGDGLFEEVVGESGSRDESSRVPIIGFPGDIDGANDGFGEMKGEIA